MTWCIVCYGYLQDILSSLAISFYSLYLCQYYAGAVYVGLETNVVFNIFIINLSVEVNFTIFSLYPSSLYPYLYLYPPILQSPNIIPSYTLPPYTPPYTLPPYIPTYTYTPLPYSLPILYPPILFHPILLPIPYTPTYTSLSSLYYIIPSYTLPPYTPPYTYTLPILYPCMPSYTLPISYPLLYLPPHPSLYPPYGPPIAL